MTKSKNTQTTQIQIRCTGEEKAELGKLAAKSGLSMSEYVRSLLFGEKVVVRVKK